MSCWTRSTLGIGPLGGSVIGLRFHRSEWEVCWLDCISGLGSRMRCDNVTASVVARFLLFMIRAALDEHGP